MGHTKTPEQQLYFDVVTSDSEKRALMFIERYVAQAKQQAMEETRGQTLAEVIALMNTLPMNTTLRDARHAVKELYLKSLKEPHA